jgi:hypothetical protein
LHKLTNRDQNKLVKIMRTWNRNLKAVRDNELNIRLRELVAVLVLSSEVCIREPRVVALNLPHAALALDAAQSLCALMKELPDACFIPASGAASEHLSLCQILKARDAAWIRNLGHARRKPVQHSRILDGIQPLLLTSSPPTGCRRKCKMRRRATTCAAASRMA